MSPTASRTAVRSLARVYKGRWMLAAAWLVLAGAVIGMAQEFCHTDDGCPVEIHCLACQRTLLTLAVTGGSPSYLRSLEPSHRIDAVAPPLVSQADIPASASRGPPT